MEKKGYKSLLFCEKSGSMTIEDSLTEEKDFPFQDKSFFLNKFNKDRYRINVEIYM